jgi:AbrB family looped-hinge helix DNA binding protein
MMRYTVKVTRKGQITVPKAIREFLGTDTLEMGMREGEVVIRPLSSVVGALRRYMKDGIPDKSRVWEEALKEKTRKWRRQR